MSMTKRYLESLPQEQQDEILGYMDDHLRTMGGLEWLAMLDAATASEPVYELRPGLRRCNERMRYTGHQCQLAEGHVLSHSHDPVHESRIAAVEAEALADETEDADGCEVEHGNEDDIEGTEDDQC